MNVHEAILLLMFACFCMAGCQTRPPPKPVAASTQKQAPSPQPPQERKTQLVRQVKDRSPEQIQMLSDFAMKESPKIWQAIQSLRGEIAQSEARIKQLRADLLEFDRNPDADEDYKALVAGLQELRRTYDAVFEKLENAYIAAKKYEASPRCKDYQETMKRALEDGIQDATLATERYKAMTRQK